MTPDEITDVIKARRFALCHVGIGWAQPLNDGRTVALLRQHHSLGPMPVEQYFGGWKAAPWYVWLGVLPEERPWPAEEVEWTFHSGPYRTRREAAAVALLERQP